MGHRQKNSRQFPLQNADALVVTLRTRTTQRAFTLLELLVVMGIISILLVAIVPVVSSLSKSSGRKSGASNLVGAIEQARAQAMKSGRSTYVVFPTFPTGTTQATMERYNCKTYSIFEDDPANPTQPKQLTTWKTLPGGVSLRPSSISTLALPSSLPTPPTLSFSPDQSATPTFYCIQFNSNGETELPATNITLTLFEGYVNGATEVVTSQKDSNGAPAATEAVTISHFTGRANYRTP